MFVLGVVGRSKYRPYATFFILIVNVVVFAFTSLLYFINKDAYLSFMQYHALNVCAVGHESFLSTAFSTIGSMFIHADFLHLIGNIMVLWIFGATVERYFGHKTFIAFYLAAGFAAAVGHGLFGGVACPTPDANGYVIGASGAIYGVMGAFLFIRPLGKVVIAVRYLPFFSFRLPAFMFLGYTVLLDVMAGFGMTESGSVANWGHIGGFVAGFVIIFIFAFFKPIPRSENDPFAYLDDDD